VSKSSLPTKRDVRFLLAEDIRQEASTRPTLLGLIPGERFMVGGSPPSVAPPGTAFVLPSLAFVFIITGGHGKFEGRFRIVAPDRKTPAVDIPVEEPIAIAPGKVSVFGTTAKPFIGSAFGKYSVELQVGNTSFKFPMMITKGAATPKKR
jgi:hypothetical protein